MTFESDEIIQQDVTSAESSEPQSTQSEDTNSNSSASNEAEGTQTNKALPFHEDPRIRDFIERQVSKQTQSYEQKLAEMERRYQSFNQTPREPAAAPKEHPFVAKLKEIDPTYGEWASNLEKAAQQAQEFTAWKQEQENQRIVQQYESTIEKLHAEHKVPKELQSLIKDSIDAAAFSGKVGMKDLADFYKAKAESVLKYEEARNRAQRASYVQDKSKDAAAPTSQPRGKPASAKAPQAPMDRETLYANVVKSSLTKSKAENDL